MKNVQLFCLPYAGGNPEFFNGLKAQLPDSIQFEVFEYAGHGKRLKEPFYESFEQLAQDAAGFINERLRPEEELMLFGYSMGTIGMYEMLAGGMLDKQPEHVFLASHESPDRKWHSKSYLHLSDEEFFDRMKQFGGFDDVDPKMLKNRFFRRMYFEPIRADYRIIGVYPENTKYRFTMPATMLYSPKDIPTESIHGWDSFFAGGSEFVELGENHFFLKECAEQTAEIIQKAAENL